MIRTFCDRCDTEIRPTEDKMLEKVRFPHLPGKLYSMKPNGMTATIQYLDLDSYGDKETSHGKHVCMYCIREAIVEAIPERPAQIGDQVVTNTGQQVKGFDRSVEG